MKHIFAPTADLHFASWMLKKVVVVSLFAIAGCGGKVIEIVPSDGGHTDTATVEDTGFAADSAPPTRDSAPPGPETLVPDAPGPDCGSCVAEHCKSEEDACSASTDCQAVGKCINDCGGDATCQNACINDESKPGVKLVVALIQCAQDHCATECGF